MGQIMVSHTQGPQISFLNQSPAVSGEPRRERMYKMQGRDFHCGEEGRAANPLAVACLRPPVRRYLRNAVKLNRVLLPLLESL